MPLPRDGSSSSLGSLGSFADAAHTPLVPDVVARAGRAALDREEIRCGTLSLIAPMGVGTNTWGTNPEKFNQAEIRGAFEQSLALGVTLFDTAQIYSGGQSEACLGQLASTVPGGEQAIIMSKFNALGKAPDALVQSLRESLQRLRKESLDVFFIHHPKGDRERLADQLKQAYDLGLLKNVGVSNYGVEELRAFHASLQRRGVPLAFNEVEFSLLRRAPETGGLLRVCKELGVTVVAWAPLAQGRLTGKHGANVCADTAAVVRELQAIADARSMTPGQIAINWCVCKGTIPIPGARTRDQALQNAGGAVGWRLTVEEVARLDRVALEDRGLYRASEAIFSTYGWPWCPVRPIARFFVWIVLALARCCLPLQEKYRDR